MKYPDNIHTVHTAIMRKRRKKQCLSTTQQ